MLMRFGHALRSHPRLTLRHYVLGGGRLLRAQHRHGHRTPNGEQDRKQNQ